VLLGVQQMAAQRAFDRAIANGRATRRQRRSAAMKASWAKRREQPDVADGVEQVAALDVPNVRAHARASSGPTPATVQAARDQRLCMARTRAGTPCVRRVVSGKQRCPNHGGLSTGPKTVAGKARVAATQRALWARYRQERQECTT
jgi:hypothetical protein